MQLHSIDAGHFKLDGGAMFGVVPKTIWNKLNPADDNNLCSFDMRCLLIEDGNRLLLIDTGMGNKQDPKWQAYYYRHGAGDLRRSIEKAGFGLGEVTDVIFSHLHFDHCGGGVELHGDGYAPTFSNAKYWTHSQHWHNANFPNAREKATFFKENILPIQEAGQLFFSDKIENAFGLNVLPIYVDGHTEKMTMLQINCQGQTVVFAADTLPTFAHLPLPYVMGYDVRPLQTMTEKETLLKAALEDNHVLFSCHDPLFECCTVEQTEKGIRVKDKGSLRNYLG